VHDNPLVRWLTRRFLNDEGSVSPLYVDDRSDGRRRDGSEDSDAIPPFKMGNNQYGAAGTNKCYNCRIKKYKVRVQ
jgi:hypothetical protein